MPISENIKNEIARLSILEDEKNLLLDFLESEDEGTHRYQEKYQKLINEYLAKHKKEVDEN